MDSGVLNRVISSLREVFDNKGVVPPELSAQTRLDHTLGLESLDYAELVVRLEQEFGTDPFSSGTPPRVETVGDLASYYE